MSSRPFMIVFPFLRVGAWGRLSVDIWGSVSGVNSGLTKLIIRVFSSERGDSCVGGPFKSAPLIWAVEVIGVIAPRFTSSSQRCVCSLQGVLDVTHVFMHAHAHTHMCVHLQVAERCAYISHPLFYDQFHLLACVQLSVQLLQVGEGSVFNSPRNPSFFPSLLNGPDVDQ